MERLAYTGQKNTNSENKGTKKSRFNVRIDLDTIIMYAKDAAIGVIMGIGSFMVLLTTFGLSWHRGSWFYGSFSDGLTYTWNTVARHLAAVDGVFPK